ncbi:MAG: hypothetical protein ACR2F1_12070 [Nitrososphaeraceae archaeon]
MSSSSSCNNNNNLVLVSPFTSIEGNGKNTAESGLDFILNHFDPNGRVSLFPRTIMTKKLEYQKRYQKGVYSREEALEYFEESDFIDCRINAFPYYTEYKGVQRYPPNIIFIDLDKNDFKSFTALKLALSKTLRNIKEKLNGFPTVLWSGNGYHIIQPVKSPKILVDGVLETVVLENITELKNYDKPSQEFLRFAKDYSSDGKADKSNRPSFKSCLVRIPNSINSKSKTKVTIIQKWNMIRSPITIELLLEFKRYLRHKDIEAENIRRKYINNFCNSNNNCYYDWIESKVLQKEFSDYRKLIVGLILAPYLVVIKKLSYEESYKIINEWVMRCNSVRKLDFDPKYLINNNLKSTHKKLIPPMTIYKLKTNYPNLYLLLDQNNSNSSNQIISSSNQTEREREA